MNPTRITVLPFAAPRWRADPESARVARGLATLVEERLRLIPNSSTWLQHFLLRPPGGGETRHYLNRTTLWRFDEVLNVKVPEGMQPTHFVHGSFSQDEVISCFIEAVDVEGREPIFSREMRVSHEDFIGEFFHLLADIAAIVEPRTPRHLLRRIGAPGTRNAMAFRHYLLGLAQRIPASTGALGGDAGPFVSFEEAVALDPTFVEPCRAIDALAQECFRNDRNTEEAVDVLRRMSAEELHYPGFRRTLGVFLYDHGEYGEARVHLERFLEGPEAQRDPTAPAAFVRLAAIYHRSEGCARALELLKRAAQLYSHDPDVIESYGVVLAESGRASDAERCWRRVLDMQPTRPVSLSNLGTAYWKKGDVERARILLERSIESPESGEMAYTRLLDFLIGVDELPRADEVATEWVERFPHDWRGWLKLAHIRRVRGDEQASVHCLRKAHEYAGKGDTNHELALAWFALREPADHQLFQRIRKAAALFEADSPTDTDSPEAERARNEHRTAVLQALGELLGRHPDTPFLWLAMAEQAAQAGHYDQAAEAQWRVTELTPESPEAFNRLGVLLALRQRRREALGPLRKAVAMAPGRTSFRKNLIRALIETGNTVEAREHLREALALRPEDAALLELEEQINERMRLGSDAPDSAGFLQRMKLMLRWPRRG